MHNWVMQVLWPDRGVAGEDITGAGWWDNGLRRGDVVEVEYFHPAWVEYKYIGGVYLGDDDEG